MIFLTALCSLLLVVMILVVYCRVSFLLEKSKSCRTCPCARQKAFLRHVKEYPCTRSLSLRTLASEQNSLSSVEQFLLSLRYWLYGMDCISISGWECALEACRMVFSAVCFRYSPLERHPYSCLVMVTSRKVIDVSLKCIVQCKFEVFLFMAIMNKLSASGEPSHIIRMSSIYPWDDMTGKWQQPLTR